jgi:PAS domain S-box-containing protein
LEIRGIFLYLLTNETMMKGSWESLRKKYGSFLHALAILLFMLAVTGQVFGSAATAPQAITTTFLHFLLTIIGALVIICTGIIFFSVKLKKINRELTNRNERIEEINSQLQKTNKELEIQKDLLNKKYYESDKFFWKLIQSADDGISFYDKEWNLKYANPAFYSVIGYDVESYHSADPAYFIHSDDSEYPKKRMNGLREKGIFVSEVKLRHKDGHYVNLSTRSVIVRDEAGEIFGALTISRDTTELKQVHEELVKANLEAEMSNRLKSSFLANISHEIRTPLNSVVGFSNLLLENDLSTETKEEYIEHINHNSEKLLQIIGDIIDLSRLESSQIEITYEEASVNSIVNEVVEEAKKGIKRNEKPIILNVKDQFEEDSDLIFTDRIWLKRVLMHLMDNAVKFTLDGSIEFSFYRENEDLIFKIKDTGIGINKENLGHIFEEFRQEIDGHHRPFEGLGIGLTLAKEVIERMGGKIFVQSEKGIGSEFSFSIPYRPAGSTKAKLKALFKDQMEGPLDWSSKKCLLVDDNKDVLIYLKRILLDTGVNVITARSGVEAIEIVKGNHDLDIVVLDMQMPEMNGIEVTQEIRKISRDIPIIAQTAFIFEDDKDIILQAGCDACLIKPIRKEHLITVMSSFIKPN